MAGSYSYLADVINHHADRYLDTKLAEKREAERRQNMLADEARHEEADIRTEGRHNVREDTVHERSRTELVADETRRMGQATKAMLNANGLNPDMNDPTAVAAAIARLGPDEKEKLQLIHEIGVGVTQGVQVEGDYTKVDLDQLRAMAAKQRAAMGQIKTANTAAWQKVEAGVQSQLDMANAMAANPTLEPAELMDIRKRVALDLGAKSIDGKDLDQQKKIEFDRQVLAQISSAKEYKSYQARKEAAGLTQQLNNLIDSSKVPPLAPGAAGAGASPRIDTQAQLDAAGKAFLSGVSPGAGGAGTPAALAAVPASGPFNSTIGAPTSAYIDPRNDPTAGVVPVTPIAATRPPGGIIGAANWLGRTAVNAPAAIDSSVDWAGRKASALGSYMLGGQSYLDADRAKRAAVSAAFPDAVAKARENMIRNPDPSAALY